MSRKSIGKTFPPPDSSARRRITFSIPQFTPSSRAYSSRSSIHYGHKSSPSRPSPHQSSLSRTPRSHANTPRPRTPPSGAKSRPTQQAIRDATTVVRTFLVNNGQSDSSLAGGRPPSQTDFHAIFQFIYRTFDDSFDLNSSKKEDQQILDVLKMMKCPYPLTPMQIRAVGSTMAWPYVVMMLEWLVRLADKLIKVEAPSGEDNLPWYISPVDKYDRLLVRYFFEAYPAHLDKAPKRVAAAKIGLVDDYASLKNESSADSDSKLDETAALEQETANMQQEIAKIHAEDKVSKSLENDCKKLGDYIAKLEKISLLYPQRLQTIRDNIEDVTLRIDAASETRQRLSHELEARGVSSDRVLELTARKSDLQQVLHDKAQQHNHAEESCNDELHRLQVEYHQVEDRTNDNNQSCLQLGLGHVVVLNPDVLTTASGAIFKGGANLDKIADAIRDEVDPLHQQLRDVYVEGNDIGDQISQMQEAIDDLKLQREEAERELQRKKDQLDSAKQNAAKFLRENNDLRENLRQSRENTKQESAEKVMEVRAQLVELKRKVLEDPIQRLREVESVKEEGIHLAQMVTESVVAHRQAMSRMLDSVESVLETQVYANGESVTSNE